MTSEDQWKKFYEGLRKKNSGVGFGKKQQYNDVWDFMTYQGHKYKDQHEATQAYFDYKIQTLSEKQALKEKQVANSEFGEAMKRKPMSVPVHSFPETQKARTKASHAQWVYDKIQEKTKADAEEILRAEKAMRNEAQKAKRKANDRKAYDNSVTSLLTTDSDLEDRFQHIIRRFTLKTIENRRSKSVPETRYELSPQDRLWSFIEAGNPDAPFDMFSGEELGTELYHDLENILREVIHRFPTSPGRDVYDRIVAKHLGRSTSQQLVRAAARRAATYNSKSHGKRRTDRAGPGTAVEPIVPTGDLLGLTEPTTNLLRFPPKEEELAGLFGGRKRTRTTRRKSRNSRK